jgi:Na+/citrate or Na+/malate symporter
VEGSVIFLIRLYLVLGALLYFIPDTAVQVGGTITIVVGTAFGLWVGLLSPTSLVLSIVPKHAGGYGSLAMAA